MRCSRWPSCVSSHERPPIQSEQHPSFNAAFAATLPAAAHELPLLLEATPPEFEGTAAAPKLLRLRREAAHAFECIEPLLAGADASALSAPSTDLTAAKNSYPDSYPCYLNSYSDSTGYLEAIWGLDSSRG